VEKLFHSERGDTVRKKGDTPKIGITSSKGRIRVKDEKMEKGKGPKDCFRRGALARRERGHLSEVGKSIRTNEKRKPCRNGT